MPPRRESRSREGTGVRTGGDTGLRRRFFSSKLLSEATFRTCLVLSAFLSVSFLLRVAAVRAQRAGAKVASVLNPLKMNSFLHCVNVQGGLLITIR